jgi:hypothetical protein
MRPWLVLVISVLSCGVASADEPPSRFRVELAASSELRAFAFGDGPEELLPAARFELGIGLGRRLELTAGFRHAFVPGGNRYWNTEIYEESALGVRYTRPLAPHGLLLFVEPQLICTFFTIPDGADGTYQGLTLGAALRVGLDLPLDHTYALGVALDVSRSAEAWLGSNIYYGADVHVAARF